MQRRPTDRPHLFLLFSFFQSNLDSVVTCPPLRSSGRLDNIVFRLGHIGLIIKNPTGWPTKTIRIQKREALSGIEPNATRVTAYVTAARSGGLGEVAVRRRGAETRPASPLIPRAVCGAHCFSIWSPAVRRTTTESALRGESNVKKIIIKWSKTTPRGANASRAVLGVCVPNSLAPVRALVRGRSPRDERRSVNGSVRGRIVRGSVVALSSYATRMRVCVAVSSSLS